MRKLFSLPLLVAPLLLLFGCKPGAAIDITPHTVDPEADVFYQEALQRVSNYDVDTTWSCIRLIDQALLIDSLNPDYYGLKARLLCELGYLDSALTVQEEADRIGAITGEYLFQLGLFQAAKEQPEKAEVSFHRSNEFLKAVLAEYPDSLGAFITQQAANACYHQADSLYMEDIDYVRKRFPDRLMEIEMVRRMKPQSLIKQVKSLEIDSQEEANSR
ncbi:MAG TPA: hypothetical protein GXZ56_02010 [Bacteroidales bacterium]|jgi:tetratricopeptide (TPR) repeat protein|nr:hypothetical protein [Bacteroidales bacterium]